VLILEKNGIRGGLALVGGLNAWENLGYPTVRGN
jgi:rhodanese-related sulfurtransferase